MNTEYTIAVRNTDDKVFRTYKATVVPHTGEYLFFPHFGAYKVLAVIFNVSDDGLGFNDVENLMFVEVIIDLSKAADCVNDIYKGE